MRAKGRPILVTVIVVIRNTRGTLEPALCVVSASLGELCAFAVNVSLLSKEARLREVWSLPILHSGNHIVPAPEIPTRHPTKPFLQPKNRMVLLIQELSMRRALGLSLVVSLLFVPATGSAQFGRIKNRIAGAVAPQAQQAAARQVVVVPITPDVVNRYFKALAARDQALASVARENSSTGRFFAARLKRDSLQRRQNDFRAETGPDWTRYQQLLADQQKGDTSAVSALMRLQASMDPDQVTIPDGDWNAQRAGNVKLDSVMKIASGLSDGEWGYVNDQIPRIAYMMAHNGALDDTTVARIAQSSSVTPDEVKVVRARRVELARAFTVSYRSDEQIKRVESPETETAKSDSMATANSYNGCMVHELAPIQAEGERRRAELETAQKNGDTQKLIEFGQRVATAQQAAMQKCAPLLNQGN
jgi:hypothetical protein